VFHCFWHFQLDGSYTDEWILQHCWPLVENNLNVTGITIALSQYLQWS
jgi:hypothetical protein